MSFQMPPELTVVAIGGCGKKMLSHLCDHDWFLREYLLGGRHLWLYTMDTDSNQKSDDEALCTAVMEKVDRIRKTQDGIDGKVDIDYFFLPGFADVKRISSLTGSDVREQIKNRNTEPSVKFWWMNDPENGFEYSDLKRVDSNISDDFGGGVHRRRAISKAVFYKAITQGGEKFPSFSGNGPVVIIVGLGGGTGSGMFIDLARYIKGKRGGETKIWLFGVLPAMGEPEKEQLNAAIALTEIEYLNLMEEKLFNYVVLTSLSPTGYVEGGHRRKEVMEFDNAFPYLLINSLYLPTADISAIADAKKDYSGFIVADSHIIEYPVEELMELKMEFERLIRELEFLSSSRKKLVEEVSEFLGQADQLFPSMHFLDTVPEITRDDINFLKREAERIKTTWDNEIAKDLNFQTTAEINSYIKNNFPEDLQNLDDIETYDNLIDYLSRLRRFLLTGMDTFENELDRNLHSNVTEALAQLEQFAVLQKKLLSIRSQEYQTAKQAFQKITRAETNLAAMNNEITSRISSNTHRIAELDDKILKQKSELTRIDQERNQTVERISLECNSLIPLIKDIISRKGTIRTIESEEHAVIERFGLLIDKMRNELAKAGSTKDKPKLFKRDEWLTYVQLGKIEGEIETLAKASGEDLDYLKRLARDEALYYYNKYLIELSDKRGFFDRILGAKIPRDRLVHERNAAEDSINRTIESRRDKILRVDPLEIQVSPGFVSRDFLRNLETDLETNVLGPLQSTFGLTVEESTTLASAMQQVDVQNASVSLKEALTDIVISRNGSGKRVAEITSDIEKMEQERRLQSDQIAFLKMIDDLVQNTSAERKFYSDHLTIFDDCIRNISERRERGHSTVEGLFQTRFGEINPNVLPLIATGTDMGSLELNNEGKEELNELFRLVKWKFKDLIEPKKLGVTNFSIDFKTERWNFEKSALVVASRSHAMSTLVDNSIEDFKDYMADTLDLKFKNNAKINTHNYTRPWEISLTFFTAAAFLDNISPLTGGGGYWEKYEKSKNNILHHVMGLQDGSYVVRNQKLPLAEAASIAMREAGDDSQKQLAREQILQLYEIKNVREVAKR